MEIQSSIQAVFVERREFILEFFLGKSEKNLKESFFKIFFQNKKQNLCLHLLLLAKWQNIAKRRLIASSFHIFSQCARMLFSWFSEVYSPGLSIPCSLNLFISNQCVQKSTFLTKVFVKTKVFVMPAKIGTWYKVSVAGALQKPLPFDIWTSRLSGIVLHTNLLSPHHKLGHVHFKNGSIALATHNCIPTKLYDIRYGAYVIVCLNDFSPPFTIEN